MLKQLLVGIAIVGVVQLFHLKALGTEPSAELQSIQSEGLSTVLILRLNDQTGDVSYAISENLTTNESEASEIALFSEYSPVPAERIRTDSDVKLNVQYQRGVGLTGWYFYNGYSPYYPIFTHSPNVYWGGYYYQPYYHWNYGYYRYYYYHPRWYWPRRW